LKVIAKRGGTTVAAACRRPQSGVPVLNFVVVVTDFDDATDNLMDV
jgi:hypothetical protein